jgi:hypothetical protein
MTTLEKLTQEALEYATSKRGAEQSDTSLHTFTMCVFGNWRNTLSANRVAEVLEDGLKKMPP